MLLKRGCQIDYVNSKGLTALHCAIEANLESKMIKFLLNSGADPNIKDMDGINCTEKAKNK